MSPVERLVAVASYGTAATTRFGAAFVRSQMQLVWPSVIGTGDGDGLHSRVRAAVRVVDPAAVAGVALAVGDFDSRSWLAEIDVPCVVMVTAQDRLVPAERQREMAALIPGADVAEVHGDHSFCLTHPDGFVPVLVDLCRSVRAARGRGGR